jgi:hypothetical protein
VTLFAAEGGRAMLVELSVMEQRYHAVMEVVSGAALRQGSLARYRCPCAVSSGASAGEVVGEFTNRAPKPRT